MTPTGDRGRSLEPGVFALTRQSAGLSEGWRSVLAPAPAASGSVERASPQRATPKVRDVATGKARSCRPEESLRSAAAEMWKADFRFLPVVDEENRPIGVLTDGDVCLIGATDHRRLCDITVREAMSSRPSVCALDDELVDAVEKMRQRGIRHLPVVNGEGRLVSVLSLTDVLLYLEDKEEGLREPVQRKAIATLREMTASRSRGRSVRRTAYIQD